MGLGRNDEEKAVGSEEGSKGLIEAKGDPKIEDSKFICDPNGDTKIELEVPPPYTGLTKEELMKYSNDPFWVRLRWILFVVFWLGWVAMLVLAIIIIVQTPGCKPPPSLQWMEKQSAIELNPQVLPLASEILETSDSLGVESLYLPNLLESSDVDDENFIGKSFIGELGGGLSIVTDFPARLSTGSSFFQAASDQLLVDVGGSWNFYNDDLASAVYQNILLPWSKRGVDGFLMDIAGEENKLKFKQQIKELSMQNDTMIAVSGDVVETEGRIRSPSDMEQFIMDNSEPDMFSFYKFNPNFAAGSTIATEDMRLMAMALYVSRGSVILTESAVEDATAALLKRLASFKKYDAVMFGNTNFANATDGVVAFTRIFKGTPAYAVALNFNGQEEKVSFKGTPNIGGVGTSEMKSLRKGNDFLIRDKYDLNDVTLSPFEGLIIQFVAEF